jgi:hypothetical protein
VFLNRKILCAVLPPPPVFTIPKSSGTTRRERIDSMTGKGTCGEGCHARMINRAGFPFESFDDQGRYRTEDNGEPVDAASSYTLSDGTQSYDGAVAWSQVIASSKDQLSSAAQLRSARLGAGRAPRSPTWNGIDPSIRL